MKAKSIPAGFHSLVLSLVVRDAEAAIEFYMQVFGAKKRRVFHITDAKIGYAELQIGDSILLLSDEFPEMNIFSPKLPEGNTSFSLFLYVEDVDSVFEKAVSAGSTIRVKR
jgi:PhnB protein